MSAFFFFLSFFKENKLKMNLCMFESVCSAVRRTAELDARGGCEFLFYSFAAVLCSDF